MTHTRVRAADISSRIRGLDIICAREHKTSGYRRSPTRFFLCPCVAFHINIFNIDINIFNLLVDYFYKGCYTEINRACVVHTQDMRGEEKKRGDGH